MFSEASLVLDANNLSPPCTSSSNSSHEGDDSNDQDINQWTVVVQRASKNYDMTTSNKRWIEEKDLTLTVTESSSTLDDESSPSTKIHQVRETTLERQKDNLQLYTTATTTTKSNTQILLQQDQIASASFVSTNSASSDAFYIIGQDEPLGKEYITPRKLFQDNEESVNDVIDHKVQEDDDSFEELIVQNIQRQQKEQEVANTGTKNCSIGSNDMVVQNQKFQEETIGTGDLDCNKNDAFPFFRSLHSIHENGEGINNPIAKWTYTSTTMTTLKKQYQFPTGLVDQLLGVWNEQHPIKLWIVDNTESMRTFDSYHQVRSSSSSSSCSSNNNNNDKMNHSPIYTAACTRWKELQETMTDHALLTSILQTKTVFRMIHNPVRNQESIVVAAETNTSIMDDDCKKEECNNNNDVRSILNLIQRTEPVGIGTPFTRHLLSFERLIEDMQHNKTLVKEQDQSASLIIATDKLPTNENGDTTTESRNEFIQTMQSLQRLPVQIILRLCTTDPTVVEYYSQLEENNNHHRPLLQVIHDFVWEANCIHSVNPWFNYALPLHRCREMGFHHRVFHLLKQRILSKDEVQELLQLLFGCIEFKHGPDIHLEWKQYCALLSKLNADSGKHWCARTQHMEYWIDLKSFKKTYAPKKKSMFSIFSSFLGKPRNHRKL